MSLLLALDYAGEAKRRILALGETIEKLVEDVEIRMELTDLCANAHRAIDSTVQSLERSLLPDGASVAVTFYPFDASKEPSAVEGKAVTEDGEGYSIRTPRRAGDLRGTVMYPTRDDGGDPLDR
ncbi:hypothetical protein KQI63_11720 [bacterium]|nr:hypothetical protein [bacterium]